MKQKALLAVVLFSLVFLPIVHAGSGHITALSVTENNDSIGGIADMFLEIKPGHGAVYIESFPLTKIDTQLSTRFAKEIACQRSSVNCDQYDFFYIINVQSSLIGGPSAGGALTVLTYAVLENLPIRNDTAMTGSIMSGGIIGPVGGVKEKVGAAEANGFTRVLIPAWENESGIPLTDRYNITIIKVKTLDEAIEAFTGKLQMARTSIVPPEGYTTSMERVADTLCEHSRIIRSGLDESNLTTFADEQYARAINASKEGAYYTTASLCFSSSLESHTQLLENASNESRKTVLKQIIRDRASIKKAIDQKSLSSIADLELAMIITERLEDVQDKIVIMNLSNPSAKELAYAYERLETARAWLTMIGKIPSKDLDLSDERLAQSCRQKLEEAQERVNYLTALYPTYTNDLEESLKKAFTAAHRQQALLCLLQASQAKAEANALMSILYVPQEEYRSIIEEKIAVSESQIARQANANVFPILAYSYTEYSHHLLDNDVYSASLYAEYSLEAGSLDIYFPVKNDQLTIDTHSILIFFTGVSFGLVAGIIASQILHKRNTHQPKKRRIAAPLPGKKR